MHQIILKVAITHQVAHKVTTFLPKINLHNILVPLALCNMAITNNTFVVANEDFGVGMGFHLQEVVSEVAVISKICTGMPMDRMEPVEASILEVLLHNMAHKTALLLQFLSQHPNKLARSKPLQKTLRKMTTSSDLRRIFKLRTHQRRLAMRQLCHHLADQLQQAHNPTNLALLSRLLQKRQLLHRNRRYLKS
jgi:ribosomal protein S10